MRVAISCDLVSATFFVLPGLFRFLFSAASSGESESEFSTLGVGGRSGSVLISASRFGSGVSRPGQTGSIVFRDVIFASGLAACLAWAVPSWSDLERFRFGKSFLIGLPARFVLEKISLGCLCKFLKISVLSF